ncbi:MAG: hypothetical protein GY711_19640 [bacterium]|nr:hypothetical protein [bacterium]
MKTLLKKTPISISRLVLTCAPFLCASGCSNLGTLEMVPADIAVSRTHAGSVRIEAEGTGRSMGIGPRLVSSDELERALREGLVEAGIFQTVTDSASSADYVLGVGIDSVEEPEMAIEMEAQVTMHWRLRREGDSSTLFERTLVSRHVADEMDADFVKERKNLALSGAIRKNLEQGLAAIAALEL